MCLGIVKFLDLVLTVELLNNFARLLFSEFNECISSPFCGHGQCVDRLNYFICACDPGYTGINCTTEVDECSSNPCLNMTCTDHVNSYSCTCEDNETGPHCDTLLSTGQHCEVINVYMVNSGVWTSLLSTCKLVCDVLRIHYK